MLYPVLPKIAHPADHAFFFYCFTNMMYDISNHVLSEFVYRNFPQRAVLIVTHKNLRPK